MPTLNRTHQGMVNPLEYGASLNSTTLSAALSAIGSSRAYLMLTATDRAGTPGAWSLTSNVTIPSNITLLVAAGAQLNIATGVTITCNASVEAGLWQWISLTGTGIMTFPNAVEIYPEWWGAKGDGATSDTTPLDQCCAAATASACPIRFGARTYLTAGGHAIGAYVTLHGAGMQATIIKSSSTSSSIFTAITASESSVQAGMNLVANLTVQGTGKTGTGTAFEIKNKTNMTFLHVEVLDVQYAFRGKRDNAANSCTHLQWIACRVRETKYGIYALRQWNNCNVYGGQWASDYIPFIVYDASGFNLYGTSVNFGMTDTGGMGAYFGGCDGCVVSGMYCEGSPQSGTFIYVSQNKDVNGSTSNNSIALLTGRSNTFEGIRGSSGGGTAWVIVLDTIAGCVVSGVNAGSGITTAAVRLNTGVTRTTLMGIRANSGVAVDFQTAADKLVNFLVDVENAGSLDVPTIPGARIVDLRQGNGASADSRAELGNAAASITDLSSKGIFVGMSADTAHILVDGNRNNDDASLNINFRGYLGSNSRYRDFLVYDGIGNIMLQIDGSAGLLIVNCVAIKFTNLPTSAGASGTLWYDSAAGNVVKFVP